MLFVKQKTAYEMRISDWSSGVCSSDLAFHHAVEQVLARDLSPLLSTHQDRIGAQVRRLSLIINGRTLAASHMRAVRHFADHDIDRSEEHTSELQSLMRISYAVFCLKKKKKKIVLDIQISIDKTITSIRLN